MAKQNWIYAYYQGIKDGTYSVGRWIALLYDYLIEGLHEKRFFFDAKRANDAIEWIEAHAFHVEGPLAPQNITLEVWQKARLSAIFGIIDKNGHLQFREVFSVTGRKNGKSLEGAAVGNYVFRRFGGFGTRV